MISSCLFHLSASFGVSAMCFLILPVFSFVSVHQSVNLVCLCVNTIAYIQTYCTFIHSLASFVVENDEHQSKSFYCLQNV